MSSAVTSDITDAVVRVLRDTDLILAFAYGSRVGQTPRPDSDVDIGYYMKPVRGDTGLSVRGEMSIAEQLSAALGVEVDLRDLSCAPLEIQAQVVGRGVCLYRAEGEEAAELERSVTERYEHAKKSPLAGHARHLHEVATQGL